MKPRDMALAALTSIIWGLGFAAGKFGLESFSPAQLTAARFVIACLPVVLVRRPRISWSSIVLIGSTLFTGQFLFMFFAPCSCGACSTAMSTSPAHSSTRRG
jgi:O-acetylserine/cysteine efflux transporter